MQTTFDSIHNYRYCPLQSAQSDIRLLSLHASDAGDLLNASLTACQLAKCPFTAISYEWGETGTEVELSIDGQCLPIRHNLWLFLDALRARQRKGEIAAHLRIWVDALCSNQKDVIERNAQVSIMGDI